MSAPFITFEGSEGCGKSTQTRRLSGRLRALGWRVRELREPGGTPLAEEIRHVLKHSAAGRGMTPEAELLLMNAARAQLVREIIRPALEAGDIVVCDRFADSTTAYQGWGRELDLRRVADVVALAIGRTRPDLTLLLRVPAEVGAARRGARTVAEGGTIDRFEAESGAFFERVERGFLALAEAEPARFRVIDASPGVEAVEAAIWEAVTGRFPELAGPAAGNPGGGHEKKPGGNEMSR